MLRYDHRPGRNASAMRSAAQARALFQRSVTPAFEERKKTKLREAVGYMVSPEIISAKAAAAAAEFPSENAEELWAKSSDDDLFGDSLPARALRLIGRLRL